MSLPAGVTTCTVTYGPDSDFAGNDVTVLATVRPTSDVIWTATGQRLVAFLVTNDPSELQ